MGMQGQRAGLGSHDSSWPQLALFILALYCAPIALAILYWREHRQPKEEGRV